MPRAAYKAILGRQARKARLFSCASIMAEIRHFDDAHLMRTPLGSNEADIIHLKSDDDIYMMCEMKRY